MGNSNLRLKNKARSRSNSFSLNSSHNSANEDNIGEDPINILFTNNNNHKRFNEINNDYLNNTHTNNSNNNSKNYNSLSASTQIKQSNNKANLAFSNLNDL